MNEERGEERKPVPAKDPVDHNDADERSSRKDRSCNSLSGNQYHSRDVKAKDQMDQFAKEFLHGYLP